MLIRLQYQLAKAHAQGDLAAVLMLNARIAALLR